MYVTGGNSHHIELVTERNNLFVYVLKLGRGSNRSVPQHKRVVAERLNFEIVIKLRNIKQLIIALAVKNRAVQLARFAGRADDYTIAELFDNAFWHNRFFVKIFQIRL